MQRANNDRLLISFIGLIGAFFLSMIITMTILNMSGSGSFLVYFTSCLFLFSVGLMVYTHLSGKKFLNETLDQMTDLFSSGVSQVESIGMLSATPLIAPFGRVRLEAWKAQPLSLRNTGVGVALNVSVILTDGEQCLASQGTCVVAAGEKEKMALFPTRLTPHFPDTADGLPLLSREPGEARLILFYQDALGMPYTAVYAAREQTWTFLGTVRKTTLTFEELLAAA